MKTSANTICFSSRGQVVIPSRFRKKLGIEKGTQALISSEAGSIILTPITREYIKSHYGAYKGKPLLRALSEEKEREKNK